jgi:hypothetical protein
MKARTLLGICILCLAGAWGAPARAAELAPGGEVFIDPMDVSGGFLSPLSPISARPQTEVFLVPAEFLLLQMDLDGPTDEHFLQYQIRAGGKVAFARRFELGVELLPLHVIAGRFYEPFTDRQFHDSDVNFGNFAAHFTGNFVALHGQTPLYFSGAFRVTFPTAGDIRLNYDYGPFTFTYEYLTDSWIFEPQLLFGISLADMVTLSTRQGLVAFVVPGTRYDDPYRGRDQVHWLMNYSVGVAPIKQWFSLVADFTAMFCMNEVRYWDPESPAGEHTHTHPIFAYLGFGAKVYPVPSLAIEAGFRFGLTDEAQYSVGLFSFALKVSYEWDVSLGGVTVIKEGTASGSAGGGDGA